MNAGAAILALSRTPPTQTLNLTAAARRRSKLQRMTPAAAGVLTFCARHQDRFFISHVNRRTVVGQLVGLIVLHTVSIRVAEW
jgi:hypothetical protein